MESDRQPGAACGNCLAFEREPVPDDGIPRPDLGRWSQTMTDKPEAEEVARTDRIARAICREKCAFYGDPPCFNVTGIMGEPLPWPNPNCDEPGCHALALAVAALLRQSDG